MTDIQDARAEVRALPFAAEDPTVRGLLRALDLDEAARARVAAAAADLVRKIRDEASPGLIQKFLAEYGLGTEEGVALMCLAEAYLRTPDAASLDALIADKIGAGNWSRHLGRAESSLINASTWALMLTGRVFRRIPADAADLGTVMRGVVARLGEPVARTAVGEAMKVMGRQFVLGRTIDEALANAARERKLGYTHSFDMLGEAARTAQDAERYFLSYAQAITAIAKHAGATNPHDNPGISVKLSALHPRYEAVQRDRVLVELTPKLAALAEQARAANIGFNIDAEEADRLDLSLDVVDQVLSSRTLKGWSGFGLVIQAFAKTAPAVIDWAAARCRELDRRISVRLVKGAYWDSEIKLAQVLGVEAYPVFTRKAATDVSFLVCAQKLFAAADRIYPQFATHNAHTAAAVLEMAPPGVAYEFQRLHGMGDDLHEILRRDFGTRHRIYAPVGVHADLLAYLVRRLLENGANSSFVHQILDRGVPPETIARDPVASLEAAPSLAHPGIPLPPDIYGPARRNAKGWNLNQPASAEPLDQALAPFRSTRWQARPGAGAGGEPTAVMSPADPRDLVGEVIEATAEDVALALERASAASDTWSTLPAAQRADILERAADLYEAHAAELMAMAAREAGKTRLDGIAEVREAVDFLRYYAAEARTRLEGRAPLGPVACISPWNFPLAIFTGQVSAALVAGNPVLAKPAEQTALIAARAVELLHQAGVPDDVLILLPGDGAVVGAALTCDPRVKAVAFTGSIETAALIDHALATHGDPRAPLIAETGGLNAMIVDSTALPEQAVRDIVASAFQSAGQRCSALRVLFIQEDVAAKLIEMLEGAARELMVGDPWAPATDVGPVIDGDAEAQILDHCAALEAKGRLLFRVEPGDDCPDGTFVPPYAFRLEHLDELEREIFGPVLHILTYREAELMDVVARINAKGFGLTLGVHSRIDARADAVCAAAQVGNIYVNRNQIGAVVGVQPFGGEGLSGTGPKAGGPAYLTRFTHPLTGVNVETRLAALDQGHQALPGPTGERDTYWLAPRGTVLCLGPDPDALDRQVRLALGTGNRAAIEAGAATAALPAREAGDRSRIEVRTGSPAELAQHTACDAVLFDGPDDAARALRIALSRRDGARLPLLSSADDPVRLCVERVVSEDTTASGGNASLLLAVAD